MAALGLMGYGHALYGWDEGRWGPAFADSVARESGIRWISANLRAEGVSEPYTIVNSGSLRVGLTGVTGSRAFYPDSGSRMGSEVDEYSTARRLPAQVSIAGNWPGKDEPVSNVESMDSSQ